MPANATPTRFHPHSRTDRHTPAQRTWSITAVEYGGRVTRNVGFWLHPRQAFRFAMGIWADDPGLYSLTIVDEFGDALPIELIR